MKEEKKRRRDPRAEIIPAIWGITVGILGVSIPLIAINGDAVILPVLALLGATVTSCTVWLTKTPKQSSPELEQTVAELTQRIAQLEIDTRDIELRYSIEQSARSQTPPAGQSNGLR